MEKITYRKTLDVHKNGTQFLLQGVQTADRLSRVVEVSLMASGDAIDFPLEGVVAFAYLFYPGADEPSYYKCEIVDNKVVCELPPITVEGITPVQIKLIETSTEKSQSVLAAPEFALEVSKSYANDDGEQMKTTFSGFEEFIIKAEKAYAKRLERIELASDCLFYAYYADGTTYETDILKKLFLNGNVELSKSYAMGGTGVRAGEDTDNSKYYSNVAKSEALNAKAIMEGSREVLDEARLQGVYTAFNVDFTTGEVEYVSPSFTFKVNEETGELEAEGQKYTFATEIYRVVDEWLARNGVVLDDLAEISKDHTPRIASLEETTEGHTETISAHTEDITKLYKGVEEARTYRIPWNLDENVGSILVNSPSVSLAVASTNKIAEPDEDFSSFRAINSGDIILSFETRVADSGWTNNPCLKVFKNEEKIYVETDIETLDGGTFELPVTVEHNDVIKIYTYAETGRDDQYGQLSVKDFTILANIDTPYKYINLSGSDNITIEDVVNALIGDGVNV